MTQQLLMIEDDNRLAAMVGDYLRQSGYGFTHAADGNSGLEALDNSEPDLVILARHGRPGSLPAHQEPRPNR